MDPQALFVDALRGSVVLGAALTAMPLLRRATAASRRAVLLAAFAVATLAPIATRVVARTSAAPYVSLPVLVPHVPVEPLVDGAAASPAVVVHHVAALPAATFGDAALAALPWIALAIYLVGFLVVASGVVRGLLKARGLVARADSAAASGLAVAVAAASEVAGASARVVVSDELDAPAVAGLFSSAVVLPRAALAWSAARLHVALVHELAHVRRRDCAAFAVVQLAVALRWFDPLAWMAAARLRRERELAADEGVLAAGVLPSAYASELLSIAEPASFPAPRGLLLGMAAPRSEIASRVEAIVRDPAELPRLGAARILAAAGVLGVACGAAACAGAVDVAPSVAVRPPVAATIAAPAPGSDSTVDPRIQALADAEVTRLRADWSAPAATVIVLDPRTGAILALGGAATAREPIVPGSTFKVVGLAAALDVGALTPDQRLDCGAGARVYGSKTLRDATPYGVLTVSEALAVSSNVCASRVLDLVGGPAFARYVDGFHVGDRSNVGAPAADDFDRALVAIGEGSRVAPLDVAAVYAAIANEGAYNAPATKPRAPGGERVVRPETARRLITMLEGVVEGERATGKRAHIDGVRVAGKTGTSEWEGNHGFSSFVGLVPADAPRLVVLVGVVDPKDRAAGGLVAAPAFARVASRALAIRP